jgi:hypothetical protein
MYMRTCSDGSGGICGEGDGKDQDDDEEDEWVLDRFDILDDVWEVEACGKSHKGAWSAHHSTSIRHDRKANTKRG